MVNLSRFDVCDGSTSSAMVDGWEEVGVVGGGMRAWTNSAQRGRSQK